MKGYKIFVGQEKYIARGDATFVMIKVESVSTECGVVDVLLPFFNNQLASIKFTGFFKKNNDDLCVDKILKAYNIHGSNFSKKIRIKEDEIHYEIIFSDDVIDKKIIRWADKWS